MADMLKAMLDADTEVAVAETMETDQPPAPLPAQQVAGLCVECVDQVSTIVCEQCLDEYCTVCFSAMHRRGKRKTHTSRPIPGREGQTAVLAPLAPVEPTAHLSRDAAARPSPSVVQVSKKLKMDSDSDGDNDSDDDNKYGRYGYNYSSIRQKDAGDGDSDGDGDDSHQSNTALPRGMQLADPLIGGQATRNSAAAAAVAPTATAAPAPAPAPAVANTTAADWGRWYTERARYIPLRLTLHERKLLRLLEASLNVSEYTDRVDVASWGIPKAKRIKTQITEICALLSGLVIATDYGAGKELIEERDFSAHAEFFQDIFEIGRRHKIMNPEKMRTEYGKLIHLLQDTVQPEIQALLQFNCVRPIRTVYDLLQEKGGLGVLSDELIHTATHEIIPDAKQRWEIQREIQEKERAIKIILKKYKSATLSTEEIERCMYSIGDNHAFLRGNRDPVDKTLRYLTRYFSAEQPDDDPFLLSITGGVNGARLTHNHTRQYHYVMQSLLLWREVTHDMFKLWYQAEEDLLQESNVYKLTDTGQGYNRIQQAPRIAKSMQSILYNVMQKVGDNWVGSSVVHLGDKNVPNALMFIDKYTQVARILGPIAICLEHLDGVYDNANLRTYVDRAFGNLDNCKKAILGDFFRSAFDGSGADNFFDAGSCIDGRLTSAWHWCSQIEKKSFYSVFLLTGFVGFDGTW